MSHLEIYSSDTSHCVEDKPLKTQIHPLCRRKAPQNLQRERITGQTEWTVLLHTLAIKEWQQSAQTVQEET